MKSKVSKFLAETWFLLCNWKFIVPFALNQLGSVLYLSFLAKTDISLTLPICNSLAFFFTALTSRMIGESPITTRTVIGMLFILIGVGLCITSRTDVT